MADHDQYSPSSPPPPPPPPRAPRPNLHQPYQPPPTPVKPPMRNKPFGGSSYRPDEPNRRAFCACITTVLLLVGLLILVLWLVYRPTKPHVAVVGASVYGLNSTTPPLISASIQFTILIQNPNRRVSIFFDSLSALVSYRNQPITPQVALPPLYMEEHSSVSLSPVIGGSPVPASPEVTNGLVMDEAYGVVGVKLIMQGRLRWKTGAVRTSHYGIYVKCDVMMGLKKGFSGQVPLLGAPVCDVDI